MGKKTLGKKPWVKQDTPAVLSGQTLGEQCRNGLIQVGLVGLRQCLNLLHQFAVQLDGKWHQTLFLIQFALFAACGCRVGGRTKAIRRTSLTHFAVEFKSGVFGDVGSFHGIFLSIDGYLGPSWPQTADSISHAAYNRCLNFIRVLPMALKATIYKADLQVADMDRHYYADHALTIARHPSESDERMMARVLMYALYAQEGIAFTKGLFDVDEPEVWVKDLTGEIKLWIDIGQPDDARLRKACGRADQVVVLCYSSSSYVWWKQIESKLARLNNLTVLQLPAETSQELAALVERTMQLQCMVQDGEVWISTEGARVQVELKSLKAGVK